MANGQVGIPEYTATGQVDHISVPDALETWRKDYRSHILLLHQRSSKRSNGTQGVCATGEGNTDRQDENPGPLGLCPEPVDT